SVGASANQRLFKKAGQPLDQSLADHNLGDDFTLVVDQRWVRIVGLVPGRVRRIQQADLHKVPLKYLLGELLCLLARPSAVFGILLIRADRFSQPNEGISD